jgi:hypothetical protein
MLSPVRVNIGVVWINNWIHYTLIQHVTTINFSAIADSHT